jgi:hypothetical protein
MTTSNFVKIGNDDISLKCKKISLENPEYSSMPSPTKISYLPKSVIDSFGQDALNKINTDLDGSIIILEDHNLEKNKIKILSCHSNFCIIFCPNKIISELLHSYSSNKTIYYLDEPTNKNIQQQIEMDFPRMQLYYNHHKCNNLHHFKSLITKFNHFHHDKLYTLYNLIIMFCTQASFYYPFSVMFNIYDLGEIDICVLPSDDSPYINIIDNGSHINIVFKKIFKYIDINTQQIITKFHTFMVITIDLVIEPDGHIFYGRKYSICSACMLYWIKENNLVVI